MKMIIVNIQYSDAAGRLLARMVIDAATRLHLPKPSVKMATRVDASILTKYEDAILITDNDKYASNTEKPFYCFGECTKTSGYNNYILYTNISTRNFFSPQNKIQLMHLCEKAVLLTYHLLPSFNFIYKPLTETSEIETLINYFKKNAQTQFLISSDIETSDKLITCISYTFQPTAKSIPFSVCVDLIGYSKGIKIGADTDITYYTSRLALIAQLHSLPNLRFIFHNGTYDNSYLLKYGCPTLNYHFDTQYLFYSMHSLSRKALWHVSSCLSPMYKYWKQEIKGGEEDDIDTKESSMPHTIDGYKRYLRYCALDSFYTYTNLLYQLQLINTNFYQRAINNYGQIQRLNIIYMEMQFNSFTVDRKFLLDLLTRKANAAAYQKNLLEFIFSPVIENFNINSIKTKQKIFYDLLKAEPVGGALGTDADTLSQISKQHPLIEYFAKRIKTYQENHKFISDFTKLLNYTTVQCKLNATGTSTSRANAKPNDFNKGRNLQNITAEVREAFIAPQGYLMADIDYSQADTYFVASATDNHMFEVVTDDRDTHAVHASQVFGVPYEQVLATKGEKHSVRKLVKPISHGGNYFMTARTMYVRLLTEIGSEGLVKMAENLGLPRPKVTSDFIKMCDLALQRYRSQYPGLVNWGSKLYDQQISNNGWITTAFGFSTLFPIMQDKYKVDNIQREIAAFTGQGGTAGLMNRFLVNLFYHGYSRPFDGKDHSDVAAPLTDALTKHDIIPIVQVHDSIVFLIRESKLNLLNGIMNLMQMPIYYNNHDFHVPVECEVGRFWSKRLMRVFKPNTDCAEFIKQLPTLEDRYK